MCERTMAGLNTEFRMQMKGKYQIGLLLVAAILLGLSCSEERNQESQSDALSAPSPEPFYAYGISLDMQTRARVYSDKLLRMAPLKTVLVTEADQESIAKTVRSIGICPAKGHYLIDYRTVVLDKGGQQVIGFGKSGMLVRLKGGTVCDIPLEHRKTIYELNSMIFSQQEPTSLEIEPAMISLSEAEAIARAYLTESEQDSLSLGHDFFFHRMKAENISENLYQRCVGDGFCENNSLSGFKYTRILKRKNDKGEIMKYDYDAGFVIIDPESRKIVKVYEAKQPSRSEVMKPLAKQPNWL